MDTAPNRFRNPYVVLGIPFGASADEAMAAFAGKARGLRRVPNGAERLRDLTWALNQVQEVLKEPRLALEIYRVPADPRCFAPLGPGVLSPSPERLSRQTDSSEREVERLFREVEGEARRALLVEVAEASRLPAR